MPLEVITKLIPISEDMSFSDRTNAEISNNTVEVAAETLRNSDSNKYDKGGKKVIITLTAHLDKPFTSEQEIVELT